MTDAPSEHAFYDPLSQSDLYLTIGDDRESTGVKHDGILLDRNGLRWRGCDRLAAVSPELDCAYCPRCGWQCRISGAWFMDLWVAAGVSVLSQDAPKENESAARGVWYTHEDQQRQTGIVEMD